ncbi:LLM class flavin-dependent oxidoreductase [Streptomyces mesophilus]|uniref:LLM class flavin-dependent oxidoreductase n=1 Tax=Streptomyces mesophilus TaxID=1775132 RepID=UPI003316D01C
MRLALSLGSLTARSRIADTLTYAREADQLGYDTLWVSEKYGSDAPSLLGWLAAHTRRIALGSAVMQVPARSAAMTAMTAATIDLLSDGRCVLGLGASTLQISEGWHGTRFDQPLAGLREYVDIVRAVLSRRPVDYDGALHQVPLRGSDSRPMMLDLRNFRPDIPVYLAGVGPRSLRTAGEIADGWIALFLAADLAAEQVATVAAGRERRGATMAGFDVTAGVNAVVGEDVTACVDRLRPYYATFIGGMGSTKRNYYHDHVARMGYPEEAREVRRLFLEGSPAARRAVPESLIDRTSLIGPFERIVDRMRAYAAAGVTTLSVGLTPRSVEDGVQTLRVLAKAAEAAR